MNSSSLHAADRFRTAASSRARTALLRGIAVLVLCAAYVGFAGSVDGALTEPLAGSAPHATLTIRIVSKHAVVDPDASPFKGDDR